jgi:hypothetical protein
MDILLAIFLFLFAVPFIACLLLYYLEVKIMKRLAVISPDLWQDLQWFFGRAHPFRFRRFIKNGRIDDPEITELVKTYRLMLKIAFVAIGIIAIFVFAMVILAILLALFTV